MKADDTDPGRVADGLVGPSPPAASSAARSFEAQPDAVRRPNGWGDGLVLAPSPALARRGPRRRRSAHRVGALEAPPVLAQLGRSGVAYRAGDPQAPGAAGGHRAADRGARRDGPAVPHHLVDLSGVRRQGRGGPHGLGPGQRGAVPRRAAPGHLGPPNRRPAVLRPLLLQRSPIRHRGLAALRAAGRPLPALAAAAARGAVRLREEKLSSPAPRAGHPSPEPAPGRGPDTGSAL